jgi:hypothetical protein
VLVGSMPHTNPHALKVRKNLGRNHHDIGPRLRQLASLPRRHRPAPDHDATPAGEVEEDRIKNGALAFDLCS